VPALDRKGREIARDPDEQRDLRIGNGASAGRPLAAQREVVEREGLQIGASIALIRKPTLRLQR
jgi:hypothetical protein